MPKQAGTRLVNEAGVAIALVLCCLFGWVSAEGQGKPGRNSSSPYVSWVSQYPARVDSAPKRTFFRQLSELVMGKSHRARLKRPISVVAAKPGDIWVLDQGNENIFNVANEKLQIPQATRHLQNQFPSLVGLCYNGDRKHLLYTDSRTNKIYSLATEGRKLGRFADTLKLNQPTGIARNSATGEIWVAETGAHCIDIFSEDGQLIRKFGSRGGAPGEFNFPTAIWIDEKGDAYIVDAMNFRIQIFDKSGRFITTFGELGDAAGYMARPKGVATDTYGNIYVSDCQFNVVQVFDREGRFLYRFGKQGERQGEFWMPGNIFIDDNNYIYVADTYNSRVQVFQLKNGG